MKVLQLAAAGALFALFASGASAQQGMYGGPQMMPGGYGGGDAAAYAGQAGYAQQQMYGQPGMMPGMMQGGYAGASPSGYPGAMPASMPTMFPGVPPGMTPRLAPTMYDGPASFDPQQALYGPQGPLSSGPMPMGDGGGGPCGPGCPNCANGGQCYDDGGLHYAFGSVDLFYATRTNRSIRQTLAFDINTLAPVLGTGDENFIYKPGVKTTAGYYFSSGWGVESDYWGMFDFTREKAVLGTASIAMPGDLGLAVLGAFGADRVTATYSSSHVNNGELNAILPYASWQWLAGFRFLQLDERLDLNFFDAAAAGAADYTVAAYNRFYGGQLGAKTQWELGRFIFDFEGKAGVFANVASQHQVVYDATGFVVRDASAKEATPAFIGEVSAYACLPMGAHFSARLGYTAVWVEDLALAPNQLDFTDTPTSGTSVYSRGATIIHGFNAGMEARW